MRPRRKWPTPEDDRFELPPLDGAEDETAAPDEDDADARNVFEDDSGTDEGEGPEGGVPEVLADYEDAGDDDEGVAASHDGDLDGLDLRDGERWSDDTNESHDPRDADDLFEISPTGGATDDRGEDGFDEPSDASLEGELPPLDADEDGDEGVDEETVAEATLTPPAFALPVSPAAVRRVENGDRAHGAALGAVLGLALGRDELWVVGDGLARLEAESFSRGAARLVRRDAPTGEVFTSVALDGEGALVLGTLSAKVFSATRRGGWKPLGDGVSEGRAPGPVTLFGDGARTWCVGPHGGLFEVAGDELRPDAVVEPVACAGVDREGGALVVTASWGRARVQRCDAEGQWGEAATLPFEGVPSAVAVLGELWVVGGREGGAVSMDGGRSWRAESMLTGATAMVLATDDDGAPRVIAAVHDAAADRATLLVAGVTADGTVGARQVALESDESAGDDGESDEARVEQLVSLDAAGRELAVLTASGVLRLIGRR